MVFLPLIWYEVYVKLALLMKRQKLRHSQSMLSFGLELPGTPGIIHI